MAQEMSRHGMSLTGCVRLVHELGAAMQKAEGEGISGFSVAADNIWLNDENQPVVLNYWERASGTRQGVKGLCGLLYQLVTGASSLPEERPEREAALQGSLRGLTHRQTEAVLELMNKAASEDMPLPELLASLQNLKELVDGGDTLSAMTLIRRQEERFKAELPMEADEFRERRLIDRVEEIPSRDAMGESEEESAGGIRNSFGWIFKRLLIAGGTFAVVAILAGAILIWLLDSHKPNTVAQDPFAGPTSASQHMLQQDAPKETLTSQPQPAGGQSSKGAPNLVGLSREEAEKAALAAGLHYQFFLEANEQASNTVFRQEPMADTTVAPGGSIKFWVSKGKQQ